MAGAVNFHHLVKSVSTWWWGLLTLVSSANIAIWFLLYSQLHEPPGRQS